MKNFSPAAFQKVVLAWYDQYGRKDFPWQRHKTPYRVWVSEIMLQQTQVNTVIPYFERFMRHFPDLHSLAQATADEVLHLWSGLGYYSRARNLHRSAQLISDQFKGELPKDLTLLQQLPGIGRSTAGAILSSAFQQKAPILDGNVKRLLSRFHAIATAIDEPKTLAQLWTLAEKYTPSQRVADYTQAMMDLGATICTRHNPRCVNCPLAKHCQAHQQGIAQQLPHKKKRRALPTRQATFLIFTHEDKVLLEKRPQNGIWGGLWSLPELSQKISLAQARDLCVQQFAIKPLAVKRLEAFRHSFTHFHLDIFPLYLEIPIYQKIDSVKQIWYSLSQPPAIGLPAPVNALLKNLEVK